MASTPLYGGLMLAAVIGGVCALHANPSFPFQAAQNVQQEVASLQRTVTANVAPSASQRTVAPPTGPGGIGGQLSTEQPVRPPVPPSQPPIAVTGPQAAPVAGQAPPWFRADCDWASRVLARDEQLDRAEVLAVRGGQDARYGTGPSIVAYYQGYADEWQSVGALVAAACAVPPSLPTNAQRTDALAWFAKAADAHYADAAANTDNAGWDNGWISNYARLTVLFQTLP